MATISYDGTLYHGWQKQGHCDTVAGVMQERFYRAFRQKVILVGASRTDAGVHALGQVALVTTGLDLEPEHLWEVWNAHLPDDISVISLKRAPEGFHPLSRVRQKTYHYYISRERPLPFAARYVVQVHDKIDVDRLREGLQVFVGTHDFRSFCTGTYDSTVRHVDEIVVDHESDGVYRIVVRGPGFLHHMIRRIVGAALDVASRPGHTIDILSKALEAKDPQQQLPNAPAKGLLLHSIQYQDFVL